MPNHTSYMAFNFAFIGKDFMNDLKKVHMFASINAKKNGCDQL